MLLRVNDSLRGGALADWVTSQISSSQSEHATSFSLTSMLDVPARILSALENASEVEIPSLFQGEKFLHCLLDTIWESTFSPEYQQDIVRKTKGDQPAHDSLEGIIRLLRRFSNRGLRRSVKLTLVLHALKRLLRQNDRVRWDADVIRIADRLSLLIGKSWKRSTKGHAEREIMQIFIELIGWLVLELPDKIHQSMRSENTNILLCTSRTWVSIIRLVIRHLLQNTVDVSLFLMDAFLHLNLWTYSGKESFTKPCLDTLVSQLKQIRSNSFLNGGPKLPGSVVQRTVSPARKFAHFFYKEIIESAGSTDPLSVDIFQLYLLNSWSAHCSGSRRNSMKNCLLSSITSASDPQMKAISEKRTQAAINDLEKPRDRNSHFSSVSSQFSSEYVSLFLSHLAVHGGKKRNISTAFIVEALLDGVSARLSDFDTVQHKNASLVGMQLSQLLSQSSFLGEKNENLEPFQVKEYYADFNEWSNDVCYLDTCAEIMHYADGTVCEPLNREYLSQNTQFTVSAVQEPMEAAKHFAIQELFVQGQTTSRSSTDLMGSTNNTLTTSTPNSVIAGMCQDEISILQGKNISQLTTMVFTFERHSSTGHKDQSHVLRFKVETGTLARNSSAEFHEDVIVSLSQYHYIISIILPCKLAFTTRSTQYMLPCASPRELLSSSESLLRVLFYAPNHLPETMPCARQKENSVRKNGPCMCSKCSRNDLAALITARVPSIAIPYLCKEYYAVSKYSEGEKLASSPHTVERLEWILNILSSAMGKIHAMEVSPLSLQDTSPNASGGSPLRLQETSLKFSQVSLGKEQQIECVRTMPVGRKPVVSNQNLPEIPRYPPRPHNPASSKNRVELKHTGEWKTQVVQLGKVANRLRLPASIDIKDSSIEKGNSPPPMQAEAFAFYERLFLTLLPPEENTITLRKPKNCFALRYPFLLKNPMLVAFQAKVLTAAYQLVCAQQSALLLRFFPSSNAMFYALHEFFRLLVQSPSDCGVEDKKIENIHPCLLVHILDCLLQVFSTHYSVFANTQAPSWNSQLLSNKKSSFLVPRVEDATRIIPNEKSLPQCLRMVSERHVKQGESLNGVTEYWHSFTASVLTVYGTAQVESDQAGKCFRLARELHSLLRSS
ncbi:hypothetical protein XU18_1722 [Perkinsela sp. CCAP 1560/4]|nr:hypothetical protein XU18_1722 [Perkinsela sp. CCAP 1560/4]|eukprot:KNH07628.1 hypothetical protein XU18_1722 [Perkinsela sp. CCAP 1560/4]